MRFLFLVFYFLFFRISHPNWLHRRWKMLTCKRVKFWDPEDFGLFPGMNLMKVRHRCCCCALSQHFHIMAQKLAAKKCCTSEHIFFTSALILCCKYKSAKWATCALTAFEAAARTPTVFPFFLFFLRFSLSSWSMVAQLRHPWVSSQLTWKQTQKKKKMMRMITGLSDDTALFLVPAQSSVSNHRP